MNDGAVSLAQWWQTSTTLTAPGEITWSAQPKAPSASTTSHSPSLAMSTSAESQRPRRTTGLMWG